MTRKRWLLGILWILAAPTLVIAVFAALTAWMNARPQGGVLRVAIEPQVVWPWQEAELRLMVVDPGPGKPLPAVDLALLVDVSGSMTDSLPAMGEAVRALAVAMPRGPDATRFSLIRFDTEAEILVPWTGDPDELSRGLDRLLPFTGQNDTRAAFERLRGVLASARSKAERVVVWYTDGYLDACPSRICRDSMSYDEIAAAAGEVRERGVKMYAVAPPTFLSMSHEVLQRMTGPGRVLEPGRTAELAGSFEQVVARALIGEDTTARLEQRFDVRHFVPVQSIYDWRPVGADALALETALFPGRSSTFGLTLDPGSMGWWSVGLEPALLARPNDTGAPVEERADRRPRLLVLTWWTLFWMGAPALLWGLLYRPRRILIEESPVVELPPIRRSTVPGRLPPLPGPGAPPLRVVPTLFLGIGGHGGSTLEAIRGELDALHHGACGPYRFLAFDLDRRSPAPESAIAAQTPVERHAAPPAVTDVGRYLPAPGQVPDAWRWFDIGRYRDAAREDFDLAGGARGDRILARLAFFRWLAEGDLLEILHTALTDLVRQEAAGDLRQVVIVASGDGGFGGGTFVDWGRLIKRLGRRLQRQGTASALPEVIGLLVDDPEQSRPQNRRSLELELQAAQAAGAHPFETDYGDAPELRQVDGEPSYHAVLEVAGATRPAAHDQGAQVAALLAEVQTHVVLLDEVYAFGQGGTDRSKAIRARGQALQLCPAIERERRRLDILGRCLGPDVLLDLRPEVDGSVRPPSLSEEVLDQRLARWATSELAGAPLALLLTACSGRTEDWSTLTVAARRWPAEVEAWLRESLRVSLNRQLHGDRFENSWRRGWMPGEAVAVLRGLVRRLDRLPAGDELRAQPIRTLRTAATGAADALEDWLGEAAKGVLRLSEQRLALDRWQRRLNSMEGRHAVPGTPADDTEDIREILGNWLGDIDTLSALREHLFPGLTVDRDAWTVEVRDHLGEARVLAGWREVEERLGGLAARLADSRPSARLAQALGELAPADRHVLPATLVDRAERPDRTLVVLPRTEPGTTEARVIEDFVAMIPQPADHGGRRREVESANGSIIRRLSLAREAMTGEASGLAFAATPERQGELLRLRLERHYRRAFPTLPVPLRIALARPEAFAGFAEAYRTGRLVSRRDEAGREQWYYLDAKCFLTFGSRSGLADAAAAYTAFLGVQESGSAPRPAGADVADFSALEQWLASSEAPSADVLTLATIRTFAAGQS